MKNRRIGHRWIIKSHGKPKYFLIYMPEHPFCRSDGSIFEHRYVMEKKIGRFLSKEEVIHHIDENGFNNSPSNLIIFDKASDHNSEKHKHFQGWFPKGNKPWNDKNITKKCLVCGKDFKLPPRGYDKRKTCSQKCKSLFISLDWKKRNLL